MVTIAASYDAAQTTPENARHWAMADSKSAALANAFGTRWILRNRSRLEYDNNSYFTGICKSVAVDTIGRGPRLQLRTEDKKGNQRTEKKFRQWSREIKLGKKLRLARRTKMVDGECFLVMFTDPKLKSPIKLNFQVVAAEHFSKPEMNSYSDGIEYDLNGNPVRYWYSETHPSEGYQQPRPVNARWVIHYQDERRPGQQRAVPESTPALALFACLRRFTLATLAAAETAADFAAVLKSVFPNQTGDDDSGIEPLTEIEIVSRMMVMLPKNTELQQFKAEHPTTTYEMFKRCLLEEIGRCFNVPYNVAAGNSSGYNYASGRLDDLNYHSEIECERDDIENDILERIWLAWADEAVLVPGLLPEVPEPFGDWETAWYWKRRKHVDPVKEANAQTKRLANMTTTLEDEWAEMGEDWESKLEQIAREKRKKIELGLLAEEVAPAAAVVQAHKLLGRSIFVEASKKFSAEQATELLEDAGFEIDTLELEELCPA